jgi:hypothetical protein
MGYLRFRDLRARGIVKSWPALKRLQERAGFPIGKLIGPNTRAWDEDKEINPWLDSRPTAAKPVPKSPGRPRKAERTAEVEA